MTTPNSGTTITADQPNTAENVKEVDLSPGNIANDFYLAMREALITNVQEHNALAEAIKNAGDRVALADSLKANPEQTNDDAFVSLVARYYEISDALEAAAKELAEKSEPFIQNHLKRSGVEEKQAKADEIAKQAKATITFLNAMDASTDGIPALANRSNRSSTSGDGRGAGVPKFRNLDVYVDGKIADQKITVKGKDGAPDTHVRKSNLTYGAQAANVPTDVFREAFIKAQGTSDPASFKDRVEFTVTDGKNVTHQVVVSKAPQD